MGEEALLHAVGLHLFASSADAILIVDAGTRVIGANPAAAAHFGRTEAELLGRPLPELLPSGAGERSAEMVRHVLATGESGEEVASEGTSLRHTVRRLETGAGNALAVYSILRPPALEPRYAELYEHATDALFAVDRNGRMRALNHQAEELCGYSRNSVERVHYTELVAEDEAERLAQYFAQRLAGGDAPTQYEVRYRHASGEERWGEVHISRAVSSEGVFQASLRDITARKRLELLRRDFLHMVSHDVKAPLGIIEGFAAALHGGRYGAVSAGQGECLASILQASRRVRHLMEQFLLAEQIDSEQGLRGEPADAATLLAAALEPLRGEAGVRGVTLHVRGPSPGEVWVAHGRGLQGILENLLSNALKFTEAGGSVRVEARRASMGAAPGLEMEVSDTGRGIPAAELGRIFERFYRGSRSAGTWGSGLGLYIVRRLVEISGGRITAESIPGNGTRFRLWMPAVSPEEF